jgi:hypothetical protein
MKIISSTVLVALFAVSSGRFLDATTSTQPVSGTYGTTSYNSGLNCGQCVGLGYNYCVQKAEYTILNGYAASNQQTCINGAGSQMTDNSWSCTNAFADRVYSKYVCQFNTVPCGSVQTFNLTSINSTAQVNVTNLALGQTCFYRVNAASTVCGGPSFKPNDTSRVEIEYVEYKEADLSSTDVVRGY